MDGSIHDIVTAAIDWRHEDLCTGRKRGRSGKRWMVGLLLGRWTPDQQWMTNQKRLGWAVTGPMLLVIELTFAQAGQAIQ